MKKLIIEGALHEMVTRETNPHTPYGPDEVAADAASCVAAGMSLLHFHARDPATGEQRWSDADSYRQAIRAMRGLGVSAALPWYPTYGGLEPAAFAHVAELAADPAVGLGMTTIDIGTDNLNDWNPETKQFVAPDWVQTLPHAGAEQLLDLARGLGLRPCLILYEPGHLRHVGAYLDKGWIEPPILLRFNFSDFAPYGLPPRAESVGMVAELIELVLPGVPVEWLVACHGPSVWEMVPPTIEAGGHVRVGIGQYHPWFWPDPRNDRPSNAEQVARVVELAKAAGREVATPEEARGILGL
jgi:uncharacterized protein (DUF849 family)